MTSEKKKLPAEETPSTAETVVKKMEPFIKIIGWCLGVIVVSFSAGVYYRGNQADLDKMRMDQECNTRVHQLEISLSDAKRDNTESKLESLNQVVKQIQQQQTHGK